MKYKNNHKGFKTGIQRLQLTFSLVRSSKMCYSFISFLICISHIFLGIPQFRVPLIMMFTTLLIGTSVQLLAYSLNIVLLFLSIPMYPHIHTNILIYITFIYVHISSKLELTQIF